MARTNKPKEGASAERRTTRARRRRRGGSLLSVLSWALCAAISLAPSGLLGGCSAPGKTSALSEAALARATGRGTNPATSPRDVLYGRSIRGLTFETGLVERASDWADVLTDAQITEDVDTLLARGALELQRNMVFKGIRSYALAILLDPTNPTAFDGLARGITRTGHPDSAVAAFKTALELDPSRTDTRFALAMTHWGAWGSDAAVPTLREILERDPDHVAAHTRLAIALYYAGNYTASWEHVHAVETLGNEVPPQFRPLLAGRKAEP